MPVSIRRVEFKSVSSGRFAMVELENGKQVNRMMISKDAGFRMMGSLYEEGFSEKEIPGRNNYCFEKVVPRG